MEPVDNGLLTFTVLVGNPKPQSRTRAVVRGAADVLRERLAETGILLAPPRLVDLAELSPGLIVAEDRCAAVTEAFAAVSGSAVLIVGSPTFKGTFTGLLKLFLDLLPRQGLAGTAAVPLMTAADAAHRHAVESYLRPLLMALGATVPTPGLSVLESEFPIADRLLSVWLDSAAPALGGLLTRQLRDPLLSRA